MVGITWAARSDTGRVRDRNEDAYVGELRHDQSSGVDRGLFIVCDGMGGHARGEEASHLAVRVLSDRLASALEVQWPSETAPAQSLRDALLATNRILFERNEREVRQGKERSGTTVALLLLAGREAWVAHVGDSRVYQVTRAGTVLLTEDQNVANREIRRGIAPEEAWSRADAHHLTQALGPSADDQIAPQIRSVQVKEESLFLLCSDGVSDHDFVERHEGDLLRPLLASDADLSRGCEALIEAANRANGHDNLTAVLVRASDLEAGSSPARAAESAAPELAPTRPSPRKWLGWLPGRR